MSASALPASESVTLRLTAVIEDATPARAFVILRQMGGSGVGIVVSGFALVMG